jgi:plastocyanin
VGAPTEVPTPATAVITYQDFDILPAQTTVAVNTRVVFLIKSASGVFHEPYTNDPAPAFDSGPNLGDGASYAVTFALPGTFTLLCGYHNDMRATIVVTP